MSTRDVTSVVCQCQCDTLRCGKNLIAVGTFSQEDIDGPTEDRAVEILKDIASAWSGNNC